MTNTLQQDALKADDPAVERQQRDWAEEVDRIRGSDLDSRKLRLSRYLRGFNSAYQWTHCSPAGDLDALLASSADATRPTDALKAENQRLRELLGRVTDSLEEELKARYPVEAAGHAPYPTIKRRYDRDMADVLEARAALTEQPHD